MTGIANLPDFLQSGEPARLIPVGADTSKEQRIVSAVLASFMVVPSLARELFADVGAPIGTRSRISCFTEVVFNDDAGNRRQRPDGLIVVSTGNRTWSALVEAKVGGAALSNDQIEAYLDIARSNKIDAVVTISNQFATLPTHHPVPVSKQKLRSVDLFHFSWLALLSKAIVLAESKSLTDPEQAFVLGEVIRYLRHESSGVASFERMGTSWRDICAEVQNGMQ